jgi:ABC-type transport system substrate-binding protein
VRFVANPFFREPGLPKIREVVFHQLAFPEARDEFVKGNIQLFYGVPKDQVVQLRSQGKSVVKLPPDSVYFLAPNYRRLAWRDVNLRLALAHAIDREAILRTCFRPGGASQDHAAVTGPFPKGSWAYNPKVPDFTTSQAARFLRLATPSKDQKDALQPLTLIYPDRDPDLGNACKNMTQQWAKIGIQVLPEAVDPADFQDRVVKRQNFDLAYWRHDYNDECYWLRPLFDPHDMAEGGANFMGYGADPELEALFKDLMLHKDFRRVRDLTHTLHDYLARKAILIPLWQLDTYVAVSPLLQDARFDPITLFREVERWKLVPP